MGVRSEGTPIPIANPETPSMNPPHTSPQITRHPPETQFRAPPRGHAAHRGPLRRTPQASLGASCSAEAPEPSSWTASMPTPTRTSGSHRTILQSTLPSPLYPAQSPLQILTLKPQRLDALSLWDPDLHTPQL